jgi:hypothetical protein
MVRPPNDRAIGRQFRPRSCDTVDRAMRRGGAGRVRPRRSPGRWPAQSSHPGRRRRDARGHSSGRAPSACAAANPRVRRSASLGPAPACAADTPLPAAGTRRAATHSGGDAAAIRSRAGPISGARGPDATPACRPATPRSRRVRASHAARSNTRPYSPVPPPIPRAHAARRSARPDPTSWRRSARPHGRHP